MTSFKIVHFKCKVSLPETKFIRLAPNGLKFELLKKFEGTKFRDLFELDMRATRYEAIIKEEHDHKVASKGTYHRDPNYTVATSDTSFSPEIVVAQIINLKPNVCKAFVKMKPSKTT